MRLIDTHTHLDFDPFDTDRGEVLARSQRAGVERILVLGVHQANWARVWQLAQDEPCVHAALGLHPVFLQDHRAEHIDALRGISAEELAEASYRNSCELFGWPAG